MDHLSMSAAGTTWVGMMRSTVAKLRDTAQLAPRGCMMALVALVIALLASFRMGLIGGFFASVCVSLAVWHAIAMRKTLDAKKLLAKTGQAPTEHFYAEAPHDMIVRSNPVFEFGEPRDDEATPWIPTEAELEAGAAALRELSPPELLDAAQNNAVPATVPVVEHCRFPDDFKELGEQLG